MGTIKLTPSILKNKSKLSSPLAFIRDNDFSFLPDRKPQEKSNFYFELARGAMLCGADNSYFPDYLKKNQVPYDGIISEEIIATAKVFLAQILNTSAAELLLLEDNWSQDLYSIFIGQSLAWFSAQLSINGNISIVGEKSYDVFVRRDEKDRLVVDTIYHDLCLTNTDTGSRVNFYGEITSRLVLDGGRFTLEYITFDDPLIEKALLTTSLSHLSYDQLYEKELTAKLKKAASFQFNLPAYGSLGTLAKEIQKQALELRLMNAHELMILLKRVMESAPDVNKHIKALEIFIEENRNDLNENISKEINRFIKNTRKIVNNYDQAKNELSSVSTTLNPTEKAIASEIISTCDELVTKTPKEVSIDALTLSMQKTTICFKAANEMLITKPIPSKADVLEDYQQHIQTIKPASNLARKLVGAMKCVAATLIIGAAVTAIFTPFSSIGIVGLSIAAGLAASGINDIKNAVKQTKKESVLYHSMKKVLHNEQYQPVEKQYSITTESAAPDDSSAISSQSSSDSDTKNLPSRMDEDSSDSDTEEDLMARFQDFDWTKRRIP